MVALFGRGVHRPLAKFAGVVDAAVRCGINLDHIESCRSGPGTPTVLAFPAGFPSGLGLPASLAVQGHGENPRRGRLAHTPGPGQQVAVADAILHDRAAQYGRNVVLHEKIAETAGTVLAGEGERHGGEGSRLEWWKARRVGGGEARRRGGEEFNNLLAHSPTRLLAFPPQRRTTILLSPQVRRALAREPRQDLAGSSAKRCPVSLRGAWGTSFFPVWSSVRQAAFSVQRSACCVQRAGRRVWSSVRSA